MIEELFLLLRRDDGRAESAWVQNGFALTGAAVADLLELDRVRLSGDKYPRLYVLDAPPPDHPALAGVLEKLARKDGRRLNALLMDRRLAPQDAVAASLVQAGIVRVEAKKALGLVPAKYPILDPGPEREVRQRLGSILAGTSGSSHDARLLAVLQALGVAHRVLAEESGDLTRGDLKRRITEVAGDDAVARAMQEAIAQVAAGAGA